MDILPEEDPVTKALEIRDWIQSQPWYNLAHVSAKEKSFSKVYISNIPVHIYSHIYSLY
jgi:hypothetical protein